AVPLPSLPGGMQGAPQIGSLPDGRAAIVHEWRLPAEASPGMVNTVTSWLDHWPPTFEAPFELDSGAGWSFAVDRGGASFFGMLAGTSPQPPGVSYAFVDGIQGTFSPSVETSATATRALSV